MRRFNWQIWAGFLLSIFALASYPLIFARWPLTRDFPWANLLLFAVAIFFVFVGIRRGFSSDRGLFSKVGASVLGGLSVVVLSLFILVVFVASKWLPAAAAAPQVGDKAPIFTLSDTGGKQVSLAGLLTEPIQSSASNTAPKGVLLIFYRGYW